MVGRLNDLVRSEIMITDTRQDKATGMTRENSKPDLLQEGTISDSN